MGSLSTPRIPAVESQLHNLQLIADPQVRDALSKIHQSLLARSGAAGETEERYVTLRELKAVQRKIVPPEPRPQPIGQQIFGNVATTPPNTVTPPPSASTGLYVVACTYDGTIPANLILVEHPFPIPVRFPANLPHSKGVLGVDKPVTATMYIDIERSVDGGITYTSIGSMQFSTSPGYVATFNFPADVVFQPGDIMRWVAPSSPDATAGDFGAQLTGTANVFSVGDPLSGLGTVLSVGLTAPAEFTVTGTPVIDSGTIALSWATQPANTVLAGPTTGAATVPSFRALVAADIPALPYIPDVLSVKGDLLAFTGSSYAALGVGTDTYVLTADSTQVTGLKWAAAAATGVTSVGLTMPSIFSVAGSPVTSSGTLAVTLTTESANRIFAGPSSGGAATPTFRALVPADYPVFVASGASHAAGAVPDPGASAGSTKFLCENATWAVPAGGTTSPLTTKGDIWVFSTVDTRLPVGTDGYALTAASAQSTGLLWAAVGTVTSIATAAPITGGTITSTGTIGVSDFVASGSSHARGTVPDPGASAGGTHFLCEDATWKVPPGTSVASALQGVEFTTAGAFTWNVPSGVTSVWVTMIGGGGGGSCTIAAATGGGGGGAGELIQNLQVACTGGGTITGSIGAKGTGGATGQGSAQPGIAGGDTSVTSNGVTFFARGGSPGATSGNSGKGGGLGGSAAKTASSPGTAGTNGTGESPTAWGGGSGGSGGTATNVAGGAGAPAAGYPTGAAAGSSAGSQAGGGGGANTIYGLGGAGGNGGATGTSAASTSYGAGGGGAGGHATTTLAAGDGCAGYVLIQWIA